MKILLCSHAAWRRTGYGAPVLPLIKQWRRFGHDAAVLAVEERGPSVMDYRGVRHYLPGRQLWTGEDLLPIVAKDFGADVVVSLLDPWALAGEAGYAGAGLPWLAWCPVDQDPPQRGLLAMLENATRVLSFSQWGADVLKRTAPEMNIAALTYGVDLDTYKPDEAARARFRVAAGLPLDAFVVGMAGTNVRYDRKALSENVQAFCRFAAESTADAHLVLLTTPTGGVDLPALLRELPAAGAERVHFVNAWQAECGLGAADMAALYNALDVLLHASAAEGFGLAIIEAMACGTPVIGAANTSMPELIPERAGWLVDDLRAEWSWLGGWWQRPTVDGITATLERAYADLQSLGARPYALDCHALAKGYAWDLVGELWDDVLKGL